MSTRHANSHPSSWLRRLCAIAMILIFIFSIQGISGSTVQAAETPLSTALVLVNSTSANYADFQHFIQPYLDHFGIPYTTLDISTTDLTEAISSYGVIIIGHGNLDSGTTRYLTTAEEGYISAAVNTGTGLVNFDNALSADGINGRYQFINNIFTFTYNSDYTGTNVVFPTPANHYIVQNHSAGQIITTSPMMMAGIILPTDVTALATSGTQPFVAVTTYGAGRAVQFGSYDWMSTYIKGALFGLDGLVWRSIVWAARKPFVMQGLPPFVTMRMDDTSGPLWWIDTANEFGFIPWAGLFTNNIDAAEAAHLSELVNAGKATASIHAFDTSNFFYFDHAHGANFSDPTVTSNFSAATSWFTSRSIPIANYATPHYYEIGSNVFEELTTTPWNIRYLSTTMNPGQLESTADWMRAGPFRNFETGFAADRNRNFYYADYITIPDHPELANTFFNCITEIRDVTGYEWLGNGHNDVPRAITDGTDWLTLPFDSMAIATLFSHEYTFIETMSQADWRNVLRSITSNIAGYDPEYVSMDHACAYARAVHDSYITTVPTAGTYDPANGAISVNLSGTTDMPTRLYVFTETGGLITHQFLPVPAMAGTTTVNATLAGALDHISVSPNPASVAAGDAKQFTAVAYDLAGNRIYGLPITWSATGGTITSGGLFTAGLTLGDYTVTAANGTVSGAATATVTGVTLDHFSFDPFFNPQNSGVPFSVTIRARGALEEPASLYNGTAALSSSSGTVSPTSITFVNGVWTGLVTVPANNTGLTLRVADGNITGTSLPFDVTTLRTCPCSIWDGGGTLGLLDNHDAQPVEVGVKFRTAIDGYITGLRFYKGSADTGTHTGHLWASNGTPLATATFSGESASGWQEVTLTSPVEVTANTTYVASYFSSANYYSSTVGYFAATYNNPPVRALANGEDGPNGVYLYGPGGGFPTDSYQASNYWVDVVFNTTTVDSTPPTVRAVTPVNGSAAVPVNSSLTATFSEALDPATINSATFTLRAGSTSIPATVSYSTAAHTATLTPLAPLSLFTTYTATLVGGASGINDLAGIDLAADYSWSFTTQNKPPDEGPGGPILVISSTANPFSRYYAEILRTEGLNEFTVTDISNVVDAAFLTSYDVVILGEMSLTTDQAGIFSDWVTAGGNLIAMRPDADLAGLLGLTPAGTSLREGYLLVNTASAPGTGIVGETIQYHGSADQYTLNGATPVATLYSSATTSTTYPAVTLRSVGSNGGQAAAFAYDLAKSVIYTRQGNPAWAGDERDGIAPIRSDDLFFGAKTGDLQADWVNLDKVAIPQADEQQRLLANLILSMNADKKPLPRFWYFPRGEKAVVLLTGDDHASGYLPGRLDRYIERSPSGCSVSDWECIRASAYIYSGTTLTLQQALAYTAQGFEIGVHINTNCLNLTPEILASYYSDQLAAFTTRFPGMLAQISERTHCIAWSDWASQATVKVPHNIRLDTNYYYWPEAWIANRPGMFTGSGMPMRFANLDGAMIDVYQAATQMTDESGQTYPYTINTLLSRALGSEGYYGVFTANMHTDAPTSAGAEAIIASAQANSVPVVSGRQLTTWLDGRNESAFSNMSWAGNALIFTITQAAGANGLQAMLPVKNGSLFLQSITNGSPVTPIFETIKGIQYARFPAANGTYTALYAADTTPPVITDVTAAPGAGGTSAVISWTTDEPATSTVQYGLSAGALDHTGGNLSLVTGHSLTLIDLNPNTVYYYRVSSTDESYNTATTTDVPTFTTPMAQLGDDLTADFAAGTTGSCVVDASIGDGAVRLPAALDEAFAGGPGLPTGWTSHNWDGSDPTLSGGQLTLAGSEAFTNAVFNPGQTLEFAATFAAQANQHIGFGSSTGFPYTAPPWIMFSTGSDASQLYARVGGTSVGIGNYFGSQNIYRIDWKANSIDFYVNGVYRTTITDTISAPMRIAASDLTASLFDLNVDWLRMSPYASSCTFTSRAFDAGAGVNWQTLAWTAGLPGNTGLAVSYRIGNTATPSDSSWTSFTDVAVSGNSLSGHSQYAQYRLTLTSPAPFLATPDVQDVAFAYTTGVDATAPTITGRSPASGATGVALDANIAITFSELIDPATVTANVRLQKTGDANFVTANVVRSPGNIITLDPAAALEPGVEYTVTVTTGIADLAGIALAAPDSWHFHTIPATFIDTTTANFAAGTPGSCVVDGSIGDGALRLPATVDESFSGGPGLPAGWSQYRWPDGNGTGAATVISGAMVVDGASARFDTLLNPGTSLEFQATFGASTFQHVGFGGGDITFLQAPIAMFSTRGSTNTLYASLFIGDIWYEYPIPNSSTLIGSSHRYRISWIADGTFDFYVDGNNVSSPSTNTIITSMRAAASEFNAGGVGLSVDWVQVTPYLSPCTFTSRVITAGQSVVWDSIAWTGNAPTGTTLSMNYRIGNGDWVAITGSSPATLTGVTGQNIQYQAVLTGVTDHSHTPVLESVTLSYHVTPTGVDLNYFRAARASEGVQLSWETVNEATLAGFNLYRRELDEKFEKINAELIPPERGGRPEGYAYLYLDESAALDTRYEYRLEVIETNLQPSASMLAPYWPFSIQLPIIRH